MIAERIAHCPLCHPDGRALRDSDGWHVQKSTVKSRSATKGPVEPDVHRPDIVSLAFRRAVDDPRHLSSQSSGAARPVAGSCVYRSRQSVGRRAEPDQGPRVYADVRRLRHVDLQFRLSVRGSLRGAARRHHQSEARLSARHRLLVRGDGALRHECLVSGSGGLPRHRRHRRGADDPAGRRGSSRRRSISNSAALRSASFLPETRSVLPWGSRLPP